MTNPSLKTEFCLKPIRQVGQLDSKTFFLVPDKAIYTIGWSDDFDFCLNFINFNSQHSILKYLDSGWCIQDVSPEDWTIHLNWSKLDKAKNYWLNEGDILAFGIGLNSDFHHQFQYIFSKSNRMRNLFNFDTLTYRILHLGSNENEKEVIENELMEVLEKLKENCEFLGRGLQAKNQEIQRLRTKAETISNEDVLNIFHNMQTDSDCDFDSRLNWSFTEAPTLPISHRQMINHEANSDRTTCLQVNLTSTGNSGSFVCDDVEDWCMVKETKANRRQLQQRITKSDAEILRLTNLLDEKDREIEKLKLNRMQNLVANEESFLILEEDELTRSNLNSDYQGACHGNNEAMILLLQEKEKEIQEMKALLQEPCERQLQVYRELKSELTCSLCVKLYIDAVTLNCSHSFCRRCIDDWMKVKEKCPTCTADFKQLFKVHTLNTILDKIIT